MTHVRRQGHGRWYGGHDGEGTCRPFTVANNKSLAWNKFGWDTVSDYFNNKLAMLPWCHATLLQELNFVVDVAVSLFRNPILHF
jgi:hypothetical protein